LVSKGYLLALNESDDKEFKKETEKQTKMV
jgi:hypothetical protein